MFSPEAQNTAKNAGWGIGSAFATMVYAPLKFAYAVVGSSVGGLALAFSGGDTETARPIVQKALGGDFVISPDHLRAPRTIAFVGDARSAGEPIATEFDALPDVSAAPPGGDCDARLPTLHFESGRATIGPGTASALDEVADALRACPSLRLAIDGHADATGTPDFNQRLSSERANAVRNYLVAQRVDDTQIVVVGYGEGRPLATNATREGRTSNRRVELSVR